ncbi:MAG: hypothetical protein IPG66_05050 [Hydrogenophilales bacterium]|nr:hypothetical protein [Hydrogenophilales bacterium]
MAHEVRGPFFHQGNDMRSINILRQWLATWRCSRQSGAALLGAMLLGSLGACGKPAPPQDIDAFLAQHWNDPVPAQGDPPNSFSAIEASLDPKACGSCHTEQYQQWQNALHSHTMGPGIRWQFELLGQNETNRCLRCHAPLAEQKALVARQMGWPNAPAAALPDYVPADLADTGLSCAACHVRGHQRFGPPNPTAALKEAPACRLRRLGKLSGQPFLRQLPPVPGRRPETRRQTARGHLPAVAGQRIRRQTALPILPHAGAQASLARHSRPGHGTQGPGCRVEADPARLRRVPGRRAGAQSGRRSPSADVYGAEDRSGALAASGRQRPGNWRAMSSVGKPTPTSPGKCSTRVYPPAPAALTATSFRHRSDPAGMSNCASMSRRASTTSACSGTV